MECEDGSVVHENQTVSFNGNVFSLVAFLEWSLLLVSWALCPEFSLGCRMTIFDRRSFLPGDHLFGMYEHD